jgi:hypothetical protein
MSGQYSLRATVQLKTLLKALKAFYNRKYTSRVTVQQPC